MEPIFEDSNPKLLPHLIHQIKDLIVLDETNCQQIRGMSHDEKMEIIVALNEMLKTILSLLE